MPFSLMMTLLTSMAFLSCLVRHQKPALRGSSYSQRLGSRQNVDRISARQGSLTRRQACSGLCKAASVVWSAACQLGFCPLVSHPSRTLKGKRLLSGTQTSLLVGACRPAVCVCQPPMEASQPCSWLVFRVGSLKLLIEDYSLILCCRLSP